jgi:predicted MFS family arabinose efflux permease
VLRKIDESHGPDSALDIRRLALISGGALGIVWGLVRGNQAGWDSAEVIATLAAGALLLASFVAWQLRAREPMLPMRFFRNRAFAAGNGAIFLTFASLFAAVFFYAQLLQFGLGHGPLDTGLRLLPWTATFMTVAPLAGALADRIGERPLMVTGLSLQAAGMAWLAAIAEPGIAYTELPAPFILAARRPRRPRAPRPPPQHRPDAPPGPRPRDDLNNRHGGRRARRGNAPGSS